MSKKPKTSGRYFNILLYPDDERFPEQMDALNRFYRYVAIQHDLDLKDDESGEYKKPHIHAVLRIPSSNPTTLKSVVDRVGLQYGNSVHAQVCSNLRSSLRYLTHSDDLNKAQYAIDALFGSEEMIIEAKRAIENADLNTKVLEMLDRLDEIPRPLSTTEFYRVMAGCGLMGAVRAVKISEILFDHNSKFLVYDEN